MHCNNRVRGERAPEIERDASEAFERIRRLRKRKRVQLKRTHWNTHDAERERRGSTRNETRGERLCLRRSAPECRLSGAAARTSRALEEAPLSSITFRSIPFLNSARALVRTLLATALTEHSTPLIKCVLLARTLTGMEGGTTRK